MAMSFAQLVDEVDPDRTVLFFGSGSSVPSGAPTTDALRRHLGKVFKIEPADYSLSEIASLAEIKSQSRKRLISELRQPFKGLKPTGGLLNVSLYNWKSIFTTNYDTLIEQAFQRNNVDPSVYTTNFDFTIRETASATKIFKLHGSIDKDISDGHVSRIIITEQDYEHTQDYRRNLYDRLRSDLAGAHLIIIGHSLADTDIRDVVSRAADINAETMGAGRITLLLYTKDENRSLLYERRGLEVCFGGIDDFFASLATKALPSNAPTADLADAFAGSPGLQATTTDIRHASDVRFSDVSAMYNGWAAQYSDIAAGLTFQRSVASQIEDYLRGDGVLTSLIVGASGVGKTTAARQVCLRMLKEGKLCWEHKSDHVLLVDEWVKVMHYLQKEGLEGVLFIDNAHEHLQQINDLVDYAVSLNNGHLKFILTSARNHWYPRIKTPNLYRYGREWVLSQLDQEEVDRLLQLVDANDQIRALVEPTFSGFSREERRRRLVERCDKNFFVCLKNIFANESLDDIILREFAELEEPYQDIYRYVAAMENAGVRVHRQLVIRLLSIPADTIAATLDRLRDIIHEYDVDVREGVYGWQCRHAVIAGIVARYKFNDLEKTIKLFEHIISCIQPTYDIEIRTIRELCSIDTGLPRIPDKEIQNRLLRQMMSVAPGERVPRHRLIRNLIELGHFEKAETEIRIFNKDFGTDGPVHRYKINLMVARATRTPGILESDRITILEQAQELAIAGIDRYPYNKNILTAYADLGIEYYKKTGDFAFFDDAISKLKVAEETLGDPEISKAIIRCERRMAGQNYESSAETD